MNPSLNKFTTFKKTFKDKALRLDFGEWAKHASIMERKVFDL